MSIKRITIIPELKDTFYLQWEFEPIEDEEYGTIDSSATRVNSRELLHHLIDMLKLNIPELLEWKLKQEGFMEKEEIMQKQNITSEEFEKMIKSGEWVKAEINGKKLYREMF